MWGYSEIEASIISNSYNVIKGSINVCTAFAQTQLDKLLEKVWANINWLYYNTDGGMAHLSQAKNSNYLRRASHYEIRDGQKQKQVGVLRYKELLLINLVN